ncbi:hypothetical protein, partial [Sansalvadorimonas verongulae]|uniref:hypothetical protein n=1 Tax=Sansalvadorimonas verongulae TaxID=2172824 RepID=UPI001E4066DE
AGSVQLPLAQGISAALTVRVKQIDRTKGDTTMAGGVLFPLALSVATDPSVGLKQFDLNQRWRRRGRWCSVFLGKLALSHPGSILLLS